MRNPADSRDAADATVGPGSQPYAISIAPATVAYADLPAGDYLCFVDGFPTGHIRYDNLKSAVTR